jgi:hypothetical protein
MNLQEYKSLKKKPSKYRSTKTDGYDSRREARRAQELRLWLKAGFISDLREQVKYRLIPAQYVDGFNGKPICARRECSYVADFVYIKDGIEVVEDCKGFKTKEYKHKKILMKKILGVEIKES